MWLSSGVLLSAPHAWFVAPISELNMMMFYACIVSSVASVSYKSQINFVSFVTLLCTDLHIQSFSASRPQAWHRAPSPPALDLLLLGLPCAPKLLLGLSSSSGRWAPLFLSRSSPRAGASSSLLLFLCLCSTAARGALLCCCLMAWCYGLCSKMTYFTDISCIILIFTF